MKRLLDDLVYKTRKYTSDGELASYIPELLKANINDLGIYIIDNNGDEGFSGEYNKSFTIQSISKTISLLLALQDNGIEYLMENIGLESTGKPFDAIDYTESQILRKHINPMVNMGAIAVYHMIKGETYEEKFHRALTLAKKLMGNELIEVNETVYESEKMTGNKNRAMAYLLLTHKIIKGNVEDVVDMHFKMSSLKVTCKELANIAFILANKGQNISGEQIVETKHAMFANAILTTCGMYDGSGNFAIKVGMPAKSGVGGGIMAVAPRQFGIGIYSPGLDKNGNSLAGKKLLEELSEELSLSIF
ncbi:glutaminase A [Wukongibacter baidiensis]|uniref:glutaminase A n=1 Tax=Wukongibacter baidiensis TaxID=1723361 RepID=UPI003D7F79FB